MFDLNSRIVDWAEHVANKTGKNQVIISNAIGGYSIKPQHVIDLNNRDIQVIVTPMMNNIIVNRRQGE